MLAKLARSNTLVKTEDTRHRPVELTLPACSDGYLRFGVEWPLRRHWRQAVSTACSLLHL